MLREEFIDNNIEYSYYTYTRNPYHRIISAFCYLNNMNIIENISKFRFFIINVLPDLDFNFTFIGLYIHYYPQYLFLCDQKLNINNIEIKKLENVEKPREYLLKKILNEECLKIINTIYEKDFILLGYDMITSISDL